MVQLLLWMIMSYGISNILVYGSIFNGPRNKINQWAAEPDTILNGFWVFLSDMLKCMMCTPTWVGFFFSISLGGLSCYIVNISSPYSIFFDGMFTAGIVWAINGIVEFFEESRIK